MRRETDEFLALVDGLARRPRRTDRGLPLIWLTGSTDSRKVLDVLVGRITAPSIRYRVPYSRQTATLGATIVDLRTLLHAACVDLSRQRFGGERLWFRHYALVKWLMAQDLAPLALDDGPDRLQRLLRERHRQPATLPGEAEATAASFGRYHLLVLFFRRIVPNLLFRAAVSGRLPVFGRRYRWLMRQQYLAPQQSGSFVGFAERLTEGVWQSEDPEQVSKLLVHAFLEDLRRAYVRRPWRVEGWRRTAYPLLLLDDVDRGTDGYLLMQLVNSVRNETGRSDPLLAICTSGDGPPPTDAGDQRIVELAADELASDERRLRDSDPAYKRWAEALPRSRRARVQTAWNLPVFVPDAGRAGQAGGRLIAPPKPPWFARRSVAVFAALTLVAALAGWVGWRSGGVGCLHRPFTGEIAVRSVGGECIGYSDNAGYLFNDEPGQHRLRDAQQRIFEQNRTVRDSWEQGSRRRPLITIIYLGTLTGRATRADEEAYAAEREELEGLAVAQYNGLQDSASLYGSPLLRVVVANGGFQMRYAAEAVEMIAELAGRDDTVVAVVGLVESRRNTAEALRRLNHVGLPLIAPTLSADGIYRNSRLYLQIAPPNKLQARLLHEYAQQVLGVSAVRVYYTVGEDSSLPEDLYVDTLLKGIQDQFGDEVDVQSFENQSLLDECGYQGMLLFAGRWSEFAAFLTKLKECDGNPPAHLVSNDSVNRYMANPALRGGAPDNVALTFVSKSQLGTCERLRTAVESGNGDEVRSRFLRWVQRPDLLSPPRCAETEEPVGERVPLAYDSAMLVVRAVEQLVGRLRVDDSQPWDPHSINPAAVHAEILRQNLAAPFPGVAGSISFHEDGGEPVDKRISLVQVSSLPDVGTRPVEVFHCGAARPRDDSGCRRP